MDGKNQGPPRRLRSTPPKPSSPDQLINKDINHTEPGIVLVIESSGKSLGKASTARVRPLNVALHFNPQQIAKADYITRRVF